MRHTCREATALYEWTCLRATSMAFGGVPAEGYDRDDTNDRIPTMQTLYRSVSNQGQNAHCQHPVSTSCVHYSRTIWQLLPLRPACDA